MQKRMLIVLSICLVLLSLSIVSAAQSQSNGKSPSQNIVSRMGDFISSIINNNGIGTVSFSPGDSCTYDGECSNEESCIDGLCSQTVSSCDDVTCEQTCDDGADNDNDGTVDCLDSDCVANSRPGPYGHICCSSVFDCGGKCEHPEEGCSCNTEAYPNTCWDAFETCDDGYDNNGNIAIDCWEPLCVGHPICSGCSPATRQCSIQGESVPCYRDDKVGEMICDGCVYSECVINEDPCEGVSCNDCETCESGTCVWTGCDLCSGIDCDDGDACTTNSCNSWDGSCSSEPVNCDDGNPCTTDFCDSTDGCHNDVNENDPVCTSECTTDAECNDEDDCTTDLCESGTCQNYYIDDCGAVWGCTDSTARNYNPEATDDDGSCDYSYCGDGAKNGDEQCDGSDFGVEDCETQGHFGGTLNCNYDCTYDESKCFDGECDPNATPYEDCTTLDSERYSEGKAYCNDNGQGQYVWDTSQCVAKSKCTDQSGTEYNEGDPADCRKVNYYYACGTATCGSNGQWNIDSCKTNQAGECPTGYTWMSLGDGCDSGTCKPSALKYCPDGSRRTVCSGTKLGEFAGITISAPGTAGKDYSSDVEGMPGPDYIKGVAAMGLQTKDTLNNLNIDVPWLKFDAGPVKIALTGSFSRDVGPAGANVNLNGGVNRGFSLPAIGDSVHGMSYTPTATIRGNAVTLQASWGF